MQQESINVVLVQADLVWEDPLANCSKIERLVEGKNADIIVLPEMFTTGFSMESERLSEQEGGPSLQWMKSLSAKQNAAIVGSLIVESNGDFYNRLYWVFPNGTVQHYNKRHLFRMAQEHDFFKAGNSRLIVNYKGWKFCPLICYDLRFPVWSRNDVQFDCLIYVANWPEARVDAWSSLLKARSIENQCYVIGVNRVGVDNNNIAYSGGSVVHDPKGAVVTCCTDHKEELGAAKMSLGDLNAFREKFPVDRDRDAFQLLL